jgi:hypothetical protein
MVGARRRQMNPGVQQRKITLLFNRLRRFSPNGARA